MLPTTKKLVDDIYEAITKSKQQAAVMAIKGGGVAGQAILKSQMTKGRFDEVISKYEAKIDIPYGNGDLAKIAALTSFIYAYVIDMKECKAGRDMAMKKGTKQELKDNPLSFPIFWIADFKAVESADSELEATKTRIKAFSIFFDSVIPSCAMILFSKDFFDIKSFAKSFSSLSIGDKMLLDEVLEQCKSGLKSCKEALEWLGIRDKVIDEWLAAHRKFGTDK